LPSTFPSCPWQFPGSFLIHCKEIQSASST
jgi:hypothetical protein